jgi:PEP-CTERM motif
MSTIKKLVGSAAVMLLTPGVFAQTTITLAPSQATPIWDAQLDRQYQFVRGAAHMDLSQVAANALDFSEAIPHAASDITFGYGGTHSGRLEMMSLSGGLTLTMPQSEGFYSGGSVSIDNIRLDLVHQTIVADLTGVLNATIDSPQVVTSSPNTTVWTVGSVTGIGPTQLPLEPGRSYGAASILAQSGFVVLGTQDYTPFMQYPCDDWGAGGVCTTYGAADTVDTFRADFLLSDLQMPLEVMKFVAKSWGPAGSTSSAVSGLRQINENAEGWGNLNASAFFRASDYVAYSYSQLPLLPSVPEPSTYVLMGLGLLGICCVRSASQRLQ